MVNKINVSMSIPKKIRDPLSKDPRMKKCIACGSLNNIQWHHALDYSGRSMQETYAIQPLCEPCHMGNSMRPTKYADAMSELVAITMGLSELQTKYPKFDWLQRKKYLERLILVL